MDQINKGTRVVSQENTTFYVLTYNSVQGSFITL